MLTKRHTIRHDNVGLRRAKAVNTIVHRGKDCLQIKIKTTVHILKEVARNLVDERRIID